MLASSRTFWIRLATAAFSAVNWVRWRVKSRSSRVGRNDRVTCSGTCRKRRYRGRQRQARDLRGKGWSPGRIAKELDTDTATVAEACAYLRVSKRTLFRLLERGKLRRLGGGKLTRVPLAELRQLALAGIPSCPRRPPPR